MLNKNILIKLVALSLIKTSVGVTIISAALTAGVSLGIIAISNAAIKYSPGEWYFALRAN